MTPTTIETRKITPASAREPTTISPSASLGRSNFTQVMTSVGFMEGSVVGGRVAWATAGEGVTPGVRAVVLAGAGLGTEGLAAVRGEAATP